VQGTFRRLKLFIDALKEIAELDMLFYVSNDVDCSSRAVAEKAEQLSAHWGADVNLFLCPQQRYLAARPKWKQQFAPVFNFFQQATFFPTAGDQQVQAFEGCLERQPDAIFCHRLPAVSPVLLTKRSLPPIFFDLDDIEHIKFARQIRQPPYRLVTNLYYLHVPAIWWGERLCIQQATRTFICSELDQRYLSQRWQLPGIVQIPNAVAIPPMQSLTTEPTLMLIGGYYYQANLNAANYLIEKVWPLVYQQRPDARLIIAGKEPHHIDSYASPPAGVEFTGFVSDLDALYQRSRVVCCPILSGGGTRVKMIEAAAYGKPIVSTRIGAEGLEMADGKEFLLRDRAAAFAEACVQLLNNDQLAQNLGAAARTAAIQTYDRDNIITSIQQHILSVFSLSENQLKATLSA
jgi:glycosyltransferase involved in cell wall biosynthesis